MQDATDVELEYIPALQGIQVEGEEAATADENVPNGHSSQMADPACDAYRPCWHWRHVNDDEAAVTLEYVPTAHGTHAEGEEAPILVE